MVASRSLRIIMVAVCGGLLLSAFFGSATCLCSDDADCCGPSMLCLCTQALEMPDAVSAVSHPDPAPLMLATRQDRYDSLTFRPPTPPPPA